MVLEVSNLVVGYQEGVDILHGFSLKVGEGTIVGLIGSNGAGKSTLLKTIYGFLTPSSGNIFFMKNEISGKKPNDLAKLGISYVPQLRGFFPQLSVDDNLRLSLWSIRNQKEKVEERLQIIYNDFPMLERKHKHKANSLSGGEAKTLEIAKGLIIGPKLILIDEPSCGLAPKLATQVYEEVTALKERGISVLLVDQNIKQAVEVADYTYLMQLGQNAADGPREMFVERLEEILHECLLG